ncbi:MAG TPA: alpha-L-fucosidase [Bryobacteraceae bacterium]|nr:alpha-L-fucosidase [Bryobacteraceae bacterium]
MLTRRLFLAAASAPFARAASVPAPTPYGAIPSERQLRWHELETTAFLHFTVNTFTDKEWGYGDEDANLFNPTAFDADAIVASLAAAGMRGVILTCKHHDGFCLWPTATTDHSVRSSSWRAGKGDVVRDLSDAARRHGLLFGVYLSPWDRNSAQYGTPQYLEIYRRQLTELLTNYGPIFEVWHDGANGGDGFYGGSREKRTIDKRTYYDWPRTWDLVRSLQPGAVIFSDVGPDVRWVGNERGIAGEPCWATYDPVGMDGGAASPGDVREKESPAGHRHGSHWLPAECDVSIRPGWFWHERENARVKTPAQLIDLYYKSVGRGANLLLNVPPNRSGLLEKEDVAALKAFGDYRRSTFGKNLAAHAKVTASNTRRKARDYAPAHLVDGYPDTCWAADDSMLTPEATLDLGRDTSFQVIRVAEAIRFGQRIDAFAVERWNSDSWETVASGTSIGPRRLIRLEKPVSANRLRLRVTQASASPAISELGLFAESDQSRSVC